MIELCTKLVIGKYCGVHCFKKVHLSLGKGEVVQPVSLREEYGTYDEMSAPPSSSRVFFLPSPNIQMRFYPLTPGASNELINLLQSRNKLERGLEGPFCFLNASVANTNTTNNQKRKSPSITVDSLSTSLFNSFDYLCTNSHNNPQ